MITVVNMRKDPPAETIYIGRRGAQHEGSLLGNPHYVGFCKKCNAVHQRGTTLELYRAWLREEYAKQRGVYRELEGLADKAERVDVVLGCWCAPLPCHGDVVKDAVEKIVAKRIREREAIDA